MLAKCTDPSCSAEFRYLHEGNLFRLEIDPTVRPSRAKPTEYFWLCSRCSLAMTLRLKEDGTVGAVLLPEPTRGVPDHVAVTLVDRKNGLMLRSIRFPLPVNFGDEGRTRLKDDERHAA
jgi:hypothetical protein